MTDLHRLRGRITALVLSEAWRRRAALWGGAVAVALVAILFAKASDAAFHLFQRITAHSPWWALLLTPGIFALLAWLTSGVLKPTRAAAFRRSSLRWTRPMSRSGKPTFPQRFRPASCC